MPKLSPAAAAAIAKGVYGLRDNKVSDLPRLGRTVGCEGMFIASDASQFEARSGGAIAGKSTGFGYFGTGQGLYAGEMLVATRGTAIGIDWLSNLNIGMSIGPSSLPVHAGFNDVWKSSAQDLKAFLRNRNPSRVHCVGHSLGGALATLNADYLSNLNIPVTLYTFGSPRTGDNVFSAALSRRLGAGNIHRVYHRGDPVPMIPIFPFSHVPFVGDGIGIGSLDTGLVSAVHHKMGDSYEAAMATDWAGLVNAARTADDQSSIQDAFDSLAAGRGPMLKGSAKLLGMITRALAFVLKQAGQVLLAAIGTTLAVGATIVDKIAFILHAGAKLSKEIADGLNTVMRAIFRYLGRAASLVGDTTVAFLRWVLNLLFDSIATAARIALAIGE